MFLKVLFSSLWRGYPTLKFPRTAHAPQRLMQACKIGALKGLYGRLFTEYFWWEAERDKRFGAWCSCESRTGKYSTWMRRSSSTSRQATKFPSQDHKKAPDLNHTIQYLFVTIFHQKCHSLLPPNTQFKQKLFQIKTRPGPPSRQIDRHTHR